jgi:endonuclease/exonuclease/phosphatase family metal-dependent hydrolase
MTQGKKCTQFLSDMPETSTNKHIKRQIDYIFVNQNMLSKVVKKSTKVIEPFSKQEFAIFSDHFPVITTILIKESKK